MKTLKEWINTTLGGDTSLLFDASYTYPAPLNVAAVRERVARVMVRYFGDLCMDHDFDAMDALDVPGAVYDDLYMHEHELAMVLHIMNADKLDPDDPSRREVRTYGVDEMTHGAQSITHNIGARSTTENLGATSGTSVNKGTAYDTVTGKETTEQTINTNAVVNGTSTAAATDSTSNAQYKDTRASREDSMEIYTNIDLGAMPDYEAKVMALMSKPIYMMLCRILADILTIPYYGG